MGTNCRLVSQLRTSDALRHLPIFRDSTVPSFRRFLEQDIHGTILWGFRPIILTNRWDFNDVQRVTFHRLRLCPQFQRFARRL